ncbi:hypothetical protein FOZ62_031838, partial [Perkinsus olseni]
VLYTKHRFKQRQHPKWNVWKKFKSRCRRRYSGREAVLNRKKLIAWKFRVQNKSTQNATTLATTWECLLWHPATCRLFPPPMVLAGNPTEESWGNNGMNIAVMQ